MSNKHTSGIWNARVEETATVRDSKDNQLAIVTHIKTRTGGRMDSDEVAANARLMASAPYLLEALKEARRAIGDHFAPNDCYATGPLTGDPIRDLVQCPACSAIAMYDDAIAKATGAPCAN